MAKSVILKKNTGITKSINNSDYFNTSIVDKNHSSVISENLNLTQNIQTDEHSSMIIPSLRYSEIESILPFRIRFTTITIPGYGPGNVPPIGIAVIGYNNYIL